jgi:hypothetical protein
VVAKAALLILTCLACIAVGFFLPMVPVISALIGSALWAGLLATAGALAGMGLSDAILTRLETRESGAPASAAPTAHEKTRTASVSKAAVPRRARLIAAREPDATPPGGAPA